MKRLAGGPGSKKPKSGGPKPSKGATAARKKTQKAGGADEGHGLETGEDGGAAADEEMEDEDEAAFLEEQRL